MSKSKAKYVTCETYNHNDSRCTEDVSKTSQTVKGEAYTIPELFQRHLNRSLDNSIEKAGFYADVEDFSMPDLSKLDSMDIFDRTAVYEEIETRARIAQKKIADYEKDQARIEKEKADKIAEEEAAQLRDAQKNESSGVVTKDDKPVAE